MKTDPDDQVAPYAGVDRRKPYTHAPVLLDRPEADGPIEQFCPPVEFPIALALAFGLGALLAVAVVAMWAALPAAGVTP